MICLKISLRGSTTNSILPFSVQIKDNYSNSLNCPIYISEKLNLHFQNHPVSKHTHRENLTFYQSQETSERAQNSSARVTSSKYKHIGYFFSLTRVTRKALIVHAAWQSALYSSSKSEMNWCACGGPCIANVDATLDPRDKCLSRRTFISSTYSLACCSNRW